MLTICKHTLYPWQKWFQEYVKSQNPDDTMDDNQSSDPKCGKRQSAKQKADASEATLKASGPVLSM